MTVWLQRHDLTSEDLTDSSMDSAVSTLESFDWQDEIEKEIAAEKAGEDRCPPGMGLIHEEGQILHIIPTENGRFFCHYLYPTKQRKFLGLFGKAIRQENITFKDVEKKDLLPTIRAHYQGNHGQVMNRLAQMATRV